MKLVLLERVENLGAMGDVVSVRPGFARNFLLPQEKALRATEANLARFEAEREALEKRNAERAAEAATAGETIDGESFIMIRQAGESGQLYGSVTSRDIADIVSASGTSVARSQVVLNSPIKTLGVHDVRIKLHADVSVTVSINVARSEEEAERQARQTIRRVRRRRPAARIIVTGCAAQIDPAGYAAMPEVDRVVGNREKLQAGVEDRGRQHTPTEPDRQHVAQSRAAAGVELDPLVKCGGDGIEPVDGIRPRIPSKPVIVGKHSALPLGPFSASPWGI